jgi:hypothetical protein
VTTTASYGNRLEEEALRLVRWNREGERVLGSDRTVELEAEEAGSVTKPREEEDVISERETETRIENFCSGY